MYQKSLILLIATLIGAFVTNFSLQSLDINHLFAAEDNSQTAEKDNQPTEEKEEKNEPPKADDQKVSVDANDNVKITLEGNDDDEGDKIKFEIVSDPSHGKLDNFDKSDGTVTYVPDKDYFGDDDFKFKAIDDKGADSNKATVDINVKATNQAPKADDQKVSVDANDNVKITLEGNDDDEGDKIKFEIVSDPSHGKLDNFDKSDGTVTYVPDKDYFGDDDFKFKAIDDKGADSNKATVDINVKATNQAPKADDQKVSVDANDNVKITLEGNDDDK